jgi:hypothetical protein
LILCRVWGLEVLAMVKAGKSFYFGSILGSAREVIGLANFGSSLLL